MLFGFRGQTDKSVRGPAASERDAAPHGAESERRGSLPKKSGYSIDQLVHEKSSPGSWALEFDGPWHFLASGAPTGGTLLKRRHLELLGHTLVSVPYWEWDRFQGASEKEQYLKSKLRA
jgi:hypothetical protein